MKLSEWARKQGISYKTAWKWYKEGKLPVPAYQTPTGTILVKVGEEKEGGKTAVYARVSNADQRADLDRQVARLLEFANSQGVAVAKTVTEIGSGLNGCRRKLMRLLFDPEVTTIIVEHRDRLVRFGFEYIEAALMAQGRKIIVMEPGEVKDDLVQDMIELLTSFCARLYGLAVKNMIKNRRLSRHIADAGWREFSRMLEYKTKWYGSKLVVAPKFYPSSRMCSGCGYVLPDIKLSTRYWVCPECGIYHDRDINAAQNLVNYLETA